LTNRTKSDTMKNGRERPQNEREKMKTISISEKTAWVCLDNLSDYLDCIDTLDKETRDMVAALDELITCLNAEQWLQDKEARERARAIEMNREYLERQAAKAGK